ncbi:MAG: hypothetical protein ACM3ZF_11620 [Mycobacterium leprae]
MECPRFHCPVSGVRQSRGDFSRLLTRTQRDERVWKNIKADGVARTDVTAPDDLKAKALAALHGCRGPVIRAFFHDPDSRYITPDHATYLRSHW